MKKNKYIILLVAILFAGVLIGFFKYKKNTPNDQSQPAAGPDEKGLCLARVEKLDEAQLVDEFFKVKDIPGASGQKQSGYGQLLMLDDYNCKLAREKNQERYEAVKKFIGRLGMGPSWSAKNIGWFDDVFAGKYSSETNGYPANVAMGDLGKICPDGLTAMCLSFSANDLPQMPLAKIQGYCNNLCSALYGYGENAELFKRDMQSGKIEEIFHFNSFGSGNAYKHEAPVVYRFAGAAAALEICNALPDVPGKDNCVSLINNNLENRKYTCADVPGKIAAFICDKEVKQNECNSN